MYLNRYTYVKNWNHTPKEEKVSITVKKGGKKHPTIQPSKIKYIIDEVAYWRKANHIHKWFVDNVQDGKDDCGEYYVRFEKITELIELCKKAIEEFKNKRDVSKILPTQSGFFFGGTDYDEYYLSDLEDTVKMLSEIDENSELYYHSSW